MELIAHRGASFDAPENSLEAFDLAIEQGATRLELDIQLTRDGHPVVNHDDSTERTGDRALTIAYSTLDEVREIRLANGEPIPTFEELCAHVAGRAELDVELKATDPRVAEGILSTMRRYDLLDRGLISSFDPDVLLLTRKLGFQGRTGLVVGSLSRSPMQRAYEAWPFKAWHYAQATDLIIHHRLYHPFLRRYLQSKEGNLLFWMSMDDESKDPMKRAAWYQRIASIAPEGVILARCAEALPILNASEARKTG